MAIQLPNPGLGDGQTGDNEFVMWTKTKDNFSNNNHAASRLIGDADGNVPEVSSGRGINGLGIGGTNPVTINHDDTTQKTGVYRTNDASENMHPSKPFTAWSTIFRCWQHSSVFSDFSFLSGSNSTRMAMQNVRLTGDGVTERTDWVEFYTTGNTTVDSNKNIKTSSPVVRVFSDHLDKIHEANDLPIKYSRNGVGDYTIEGTTGLRENDWQIVIPKDDHDNQLIAFTIEDDNGTIKLKTFKRTLSMETFTFGPDLDTPLDIPEGRWVDLHFNDLPIEDDTQTEV